MNSAAPTATHSAFHTRIEAGIAELVIDRPPVNALNSQEWLDLARTLEALGQDPQVRVIVIRADGRGFCAGVDIKELDAHPERIVAVNGGNYATPGAWPGSGDYTYESQLSVYANYTY